MVSGQLPQKFQISGFGQIQTGIGRHQLQDHRRNFASLILEDLPQGLRIIEGKHHGLLCHRSRHTSTVRVSERESSGTRLHQQAVRMPMVAPVEFDDAIPPGEAARQSNGRHGGFGTAVAEAHLLDGWHHRLDPLSHGYLLGVRNAEARATFGSALDGPDNGRRGMTENGWPPGADVIDVGIAVHVADPCTRSRGCKEGGAANGTESPHRRVHAARNVLEGFGKQGFGP